jgi:hypothetical protein
MHLQLKASVGKRAATRLFCLALVALMAGCASIRTVESPKGDPDAMTTREISITRTTVLPGKPNQVFAFISAEDVLPKVLTGYGPLPAVVRTAEKTGAWDQVGSSRLIHLADGTTVREQVTHYEAPGYFAYRVWDFGNPIIKTLATGARGEWTFTADPEGTRVVWTYTFTAKNGFTALPLSGIAQVLWRGYMDVCLQNSERLMKQTLAAEAKKP